MDCCAFSLDQQPGAGFTGETVGSVLISATV